jgi:hypothetical protein
MCKRKPGEMQNTDTNELNVTLFTAPAPPTGCSGKSRILQALLSNSLNRRQSISAANPIFNNGTPQILETQLLAVVSKSVKSKSIESADAPSK